MRRRHVEARLRAALADTPCVLLVGARQTGKSTLAEEMVKAGAIARYATFDTAAERRAATLDPEAFVDALGPSAVVDEVQRVPDLLLAIKRAIDRDRRPGRFLLTGSADVRLEPAVGQTLAGRIETIPLAPFSQGEIDGTIEGFVDAVVAPELPDDPVPGITRTELLRRVTRGGFPEAVDRADPDRRRAWFDAYVETMTQREVREIADIAGRDDLPRLLTLLAARNATPLNLSGLARDTGIAVTTARRYYGILRAIHLVDEIGAWSTRTTKRVARSPKSVLVDSGLAAALLDLDIDDEEGRPPTHPDTGRLVEAFVLGELARQRSWSRARPNLLHFRTHAGAEVDAVLETRSGAVVGIEVKLASSVGASDLRGLRSLREGAGDRFLRGIVLYGGEARVALGPDIDALPISALWTLGATAAEPQRGGGSGRP